MSFVVVFFFFIYSPVGLFFLGAARLLSVPCPHLGSWLLSMLSGLAGPFWLV